ncbi:MAG: ABC transporter ATP-binding protein [Alphaproteobacteria bacterium]|nr:ABC transporter ATP-binding protein [Alphaproteobacteria bacterium]
MNKMVLELKNIKRHFGKAETKTEVLKGIDLKINAGEIVALVGPSGSGKSTLLQIAGLLDTPSDGTIYVAGENASKASDKKRTSLRQNYMGFVYQAHLLLPDFSALENVMMPMLLAGVKEKEAKERAAKLLDMVELSHRLTHRSGQLSGGEQQRVAIARSLANNPKLLLADEPTGNLDPKTAETVFQMLLDVVRQTGLSALIATHNPELAARMDRRITVEDGILKELK